MPNLSRPHESQSTKPTRNLGRALILTGVAGGILVLILYFILREDTALTSTPTELPKEITQSIASAIPETKHLLGRWLRPDGGYILEIRSATPDGKLDVGYFNPSSIHVGRAEWVVKEGKQYVLVELQDKNYPGSTYGLEYIPGEDRLSGTYYQAVEKSTFDVQFVREK